MDWTINRSERRQALEANVHGGHRASGHIDGERTGIGSALQRPVGLTGPRNIEGGDCVGHAKMNSRHGKWQSMFLAGVRGHPLLGQRDAPPSKSDSCWAVRGERPRKDHRGVDLIPLPKCRMIRHNSRRAAF